MQCKRSSGCSGQRCVPNVGTMLVPHSGTQRSHPYPHGPSTFSSKPVAAVARSAHGRPLMSAYNIMCSLAVSSPQRTSN